MLICLRVFVRVFCWAVHVALKIVLSKNL